MSNPAIPVCLGQNDNDISGNLVGSNRYRVHDSGTSISDLQALVKSQHHQSTNSSTRI